jgi:hypothetical protein
MWTAWHLPVKFGLLLEYGVGGFALMALVLAVKFTLLCIIMTYFWRLAGGATILAIAMHGLSNDAVRLGGLVVSEAFWAQIRTETDFIVPMAVVAVAVILLDRRANGRVESRAAASLGRIEAETV